MEILRSGKNAYIQECSHCQCLFAYGVGDIKKTELKYGEVRYDVTCPECEAVLEASFTKRRKDG